MGPHLPVAMNGHTPEIAEGPLKAARRGLRCSS